MGTRRSALLVFSSAFAALFAVLAISEGIGQPNIPADAVAVVEDVPDGVPGEITKAEFKRTFAQQVAQAELKKAPKPGTVRYEELMVGAMDELLDFIWIEGEAAERGISATPKELADALRAIKAQNFPTPSAFKEFLKTSGFTKEDIDKRVKLRTLATGIQERVQEETPSPSNDEIASFFEEVEDQFVTPPTRDIRIATNEDRSKMEAALKALEADNSPSSWMKVAEKYSEDEETKFNGGLQEGVTAESLSEPMKADVFESRPGALFGPVEFDNRLAVVEVVKLHPEDRRSLSEVRPQVGQQLTQIVQQESFAAFVMTYQSKWPSRTFCAEGFQVERCSNYVADGHPEGAPGACYEADPEVEAPLECPAPVTQLRPALPGSVTLLKPMGDQQAQRPRPQETPESTPETLGAPGGAPLPE